MNFMRQSSSKSFLIGIFKIPFCSFAFSLCLQVSIQFLLFLSLLPTPFYLPLSFQSYSFSTFPLTCICPEPLTYFCFLHSSSCSLPVPYNSLSSLLAPSAMTMKGTMPAAQPKTRSCHSGQWTEHRGICVVLENGTTRLWRTDTARWWCHPYAHTGICEQSAVSLCT